MGFTLKIYFMGLVAFAVRSDDSKVTALLIDARDGYFSSDGCPIGKHTPLLLTKAGKCEGADCRSGFKAAVEALFGKDTKHTRLEDAIRGGSVWVLDNSDLSIAFQDSRAGLEILRGEGRKSPREGPWLPGSPDDGRLFDWVAQLGARIDPDALGPKPTKGLVAARLTLDKGTLGTCKLISSDDTHASALSVAPVSEIGAARSTGERSAAKQAMSDWLVAEIEIPGCEVKISDRNFSTGETRSVTLAPEVCDGKEVVEAALINLPTAAFANPAKLRSREKKDHDERCGPYDPREIQRREKPIIGRHFELYYELAECRPPLRMRPVPYLPPISQESPGQRRVPVASAAEAGSALVAALLPGRARGMYSRPICPVATLLDPAGK